MGKRRSIQQIPPFQKGGHGTGVEPTLEVRARYLQEMGLGLQLGGHGLMERQAALIDPLV